MTRNVAGKPFTSMGIRYSGDSAYVRHQDEHGRLTEYTVMPREQKAEYMPADYDVRCVIGPDVLDHDYVRGCAHDAFLDAFGGP